MTDSDAGGTSATGGAAQPEVPHLDGRIPPPFVAGEREMLDGWLDFHRATLLVKCAGLDDDQLRTRSVPPSPVSLLGLVRHMADVERNWFRRTLAGDDLPPIFYSKENEDADFTDVDEADVAADFDTYHAEVAACRRIAAAHEDLDAVGAVKRHGHDASLRWIYVHMIEEYARHNGHADFLRERIDGATGY